MLCSCMYGNVGKKCTRWRQWRSVERCVRLPQPKTRVGRDQHQVNSLTRFLARLKSAEKYRICTMRVPGAKVNDCRVARTGNSQYVRATSFCNHYPPHQLISISEEVNFQPYTSYCTFIYVIIHPKVENNAYHLRTP